MRRTLSLSSLALGLCLAACDAGGGGGEAQNTAVADLAGPAAAEPTSASAGGASAGLAPCPFKETSWIGSIEGGRLLVNGTLDLQMAGMKPQITERSTNPPVLALELALVPAANEPVTDQVRYERTGSPTYRRGEIWCGGERIETFDMIVIQ